MIESFADIPEILVKSNSYEIKKFSDAYSDQPIYILKNEKAGSFLLLNEYDYFVWENIDGKNAISDIYTKFLSKYKKLPYEYIFKFIRKICYAGLIENYKSENVKKKKSILEIKLPIPFFSEFMLFCYKIFGRFLYNWMFFGISVVVALAGLFTFFTNLDKNIDFSRINYLYVFLACIVPVIIHEMSHAFTCFYYKRTIYDAGFMFYMFIPAFYVNTSDIWMENREKRFMVSLSGPMCDIFFGSLFVLIYVYYIQSPYIYLISCMSFARALFNLNPFFKWDGYYCLTDILGIYNLASLAKNFLYKEYPKRVFGNKSFLLSKKEMILLSYGIFSRLFLVYFVSLLVSNTSDSFVNIYHGRPVAITSSLVISMILLATLSLNFIRYFIGKILIIARKVMRIPAALHGQTINTKKEL